MGTRRLSIWVSLLMAQFGCSVPPERILSFPTKSDELLCNDNGNCKVQVFAQSDSASRCKVMAETKLIRVAANRTPTITWQLKSLDSGQPYDYRFTLAPEPQGNGIEILGNTPQDFSNPGYGWTFIVVDKKKFKWDDVHGRPLPGRPFDYNLHVVRSAHGQDDWSTNCDMIDPRIVND